MNKETIGKELLNELAKGYDIVRISRWAYHCFSENIRSIDPSVAIFFKTLFSMEEDPSFEIDEQELTKLAKNLILEGEKDELAKPIPEIQEKANDLGDNWLMCPLCQEAWESYSKYGMVRCPSCNHKLHNPKYQA